MEDLRRSEVRELARLTARLNAAQQTFFQAEYGRHRRNPTTALLLCLLLGCFGAHYLYFGRLRAGVLRLLLCWTLVPLVTSLFEARTITSRAFRYNASLANELLLALENTVDEPRVLKGAANEAGLALAATVRRATVTPAAERAAIAAPTAVASTPEFELAAAAWAGREPAFDDPADPPLAADDKTEDLSWPARVLKGAANDATSADPTATETFLRPTDSTEQAWHPGADSDSSWAREPIASQWEAGFTAEDTEDTEEIPFSSSLLLPFSSSASFASSAVDSLSSAAGAAGVWSTRPEDSDLLPERGSDAAHENPTAGKWHGFAASGLPSVPRADELPNFDPTARAAAGEREPVFLYEAAPPTRRDAVRLGPPPGQSSDALGDTDTLPASASDTELDDRPIQRTSGSGGLRQRVTDDFELAALGSALAAGLADLLRDRPARPRSVPLSRPLPAPFRTRPDSLPPAHLGAAAIDSGRPPEGIWGMPVAPTEPAAVSSTAHKRDELTGDLLWASATAFTTEDTKDTEVREGMWSSSVTSVSSVVSSPSPDASGRTTEHPYVDLPIAVPLSGADEVRTSLTTTPAAAYVSTPSQNLRRRVVQRVIVRKMAVVEGHVVAESTVERQVPVVADDDEMAERVRVATADAAREALGNLMKQAPEEVLPAIRLQLYALDSAGAVQSLRVSRG